MLRTLVSNKHLALSNTQKTSHTRCIVNTSYSNAVNSKSIHKILFNTTAKQTNLIRNGNLTMSYQSRQFARKKAKKDESEEGNEVPEKGSDKKSIITAATDLDDIIKAMEKEFGKGSIMKLSDTPSALQGGVECIPSGSLGLDIALGVGGLPRGRVIEIYGAESSGKTTLALHVISEAQKKGGKCCFIDAEHALDANWAKKIGVNTNELLICQPDSGEQALNIADLLVQQDSMDVIVIDSVAALVPRAELEGDMGDHHIGVQARLMSQALRKLTGNLGKARTLIIFINQIRHKIGVMFGNPETTSGGNALKFFSSVRMDVRRVGSIKVGDNVVGNQVRVKIVKNKLAPPFKEVIFDIEFGKGISKIGELIDLGVSTKLLEKSGAWYSYEGEKIGQGREKTKQYLESHPELASDLERKIRDRLLTEGFVEPEVINESRDDVEPIAPPSKDEDSLQFKEKSETAV